MNGDTLLLALAIALILEGLMPLLLPTIWRKTFAQLMQLQDGQLRFIGLCGVLTGLVLCWWVA